MFNSRERVTDDSDSTTTKVDGSISIYISDKMSDNMPAVMPVVVGVEISLNEENAIACELPAVAPPLQSTAGSVDKSLAVSDAATVRKIRRMRKSEIEDELKKRGIDCRGKKQKVASKLLIRN